MQTNLVSEIICHKLISELKILNHLSDLGLDVRPTTIFRTLANTSLHLPRCNYDTKLRKERYAYSISFWPGPALRLYYSAYGFVCKSRGNKLFCFSRQCILLCGNTFFGCTQLEWSIGWLILYIMGVTGKVSLFQSLHIILNSCILY